MSDTDTTPTTEPTEGKGLRAELEKRIASEKGKDETIATLKGRLLAGSYAEIGLDPSKELGLAIANEYDGETSTEGLAAFAKEKYQYVHTAAPEVTPQGAQIATEQARLDQVGQTAGSVAPPTEADALAKAEAEGDYQTTMAIKGAQVARQFQGR